jgi:hypothetical protein
MQIKFLTIFGSPVHGDSAINAQGKLLDFWQHSLVNDLVKPIQKATVEFKEYSFFDYYNQEKLNNEIKKSLPSGYNHLHNKQYWQCAGKQYYVFEDLYNDLAEGHRLMELVITLEDDTV